MAPSTVQSMEQDRAQQVYLAKLTEQSERYEDMVLHVKALASMGVELQDEERNLLSVAYKNVAGAYRAAWRVMKSAEKEDVAKGRSHLAEYAAEYRCKIEEDLRSLCGEVLMLLEGLLSHTTSPESKVFYCKMRGDYHRYLAEFVHGDERKSAARSARAAYEEAAEWAKKSLPATSPIRLGLALNYSVFLCEVLDDADEACKLARDAFTEALPDMDSLPKNAYKETALLMQLLRDNLTLWTTIAARDGAEEVPGA